MSRVEDLIALAQQGDAEAKETLLQENSGLIWSVTKRYLGRGTEMDDLYQLGCLGFIKAIDGYDKQFGTQFSTYAVPKISGEIRRYLRDDGAVKVSRSVKERAMAIKSARSKFFQSTGREPAIQELADITGYTIEEIAIAESATSAVESIHQANGDSGFTLENVLSDTESEESLVEKISLRQGIDQLSEREALVIQLRYFHGLTQERTARVLQVSQVQVSRIEKKAISHLREILI
ncbi:MAG: sigma-70 family RNA polymerase sigma factor [Oscillospiraceae bacterium]|nr:sigma-70 family RNA polymerase sigma factor [Oscillospiraceae bacterium]